MTDRFDGFIAGLGTAAGLRVVVGHWPSSPLGAFTDVMVERPDGHRVVGAEVAWHGADQSGLAAVDPPVRFGFGSTPRSPSLVRVVTLVRGG